ncbi:MAG: 4'-phosphopantetheinyl transferase superfamily protein [Oscillospiraceae bacterium]|nr:4'-phosphopantetheinyl transferase superfamily protein [Oscillospiraceae bacterium]
MTAGLWIADTQRLNLDARLEEMLPLLTGPEREKTLRFRKREDRIRCAVGRLLIRALAAERPGQAEAPLQVSAYGKPYFAGENAVQFSLSHAGRLVVLAAGDVPLGVDVEERRPLDWRELASFLGAEEQRLLEGAEDPLRLFYRIWTAREAFSKEEGLGLPIFESGDAVMDYGGGTVRYQGRRLRLKTWELPGYTLSLCASRLGEIRPHWLSAGDWERILSCSEGARLPGREKEAEKRPGQAVDHMETAAPE